MDTELFRGFPEAGIRFLDRLKRNNDREWFASRKGDYEQYVRQPMEALVQEVATQCRKRGLLVYTKEKNPVMRVYRDIRFSNDKRPFKTHVSAELKRSFAYNSYGGIYLHISREESLIAAGFWAPDRPFLQAWRQSIAENPRRFEKVVAALAKNNLRLSREHSLTAMPRGFQNYAGTVAADWLKLTSFFGCPSC